MPEARFGKKICKWRMDFIGSKLVDSLPPHLTVKRRFLLKQNISIDTLKKVLDGFSFPKIIGPVNQSSLKKAKRHFKTLKLRIEIFDSSEVSEAAKLLDLVHYAWDIIFCKWMKEVCNNLNLNFDQVYTKYNNIYNKGYSKLRPNIKRPILIPIDGPIGGHCTIENTILFDKTYRNKFTKFILEEQKKYLKED